MPLRIDRWWHNYRKEYISLILKFLDWKGKLDKSIDLKQILISYFLSVYKNMSIMHDYKPSSFEPYFSTLLLRDQKYNADLFFNIFQGCADLYSKQYIRFFLYNLLNPSAIPSEVKVKRIELLLKFHVEHRSNTWSFYLINSVRI